ncbi:MAG: hypothetical protein JKY67_19720 [Pseudomonadales bacterium]|nr:hypothetical protein [Pseudomonadales bacterium]
MIKVIKKKHKTLLSRKRRYPLRGKESGAVMALSMSILLVLTIIVSASAGRTALEEKMASNNQNKNLTFQAAESAIDGTISDILGGDVTLVEEARVALDQYSSSTVVAIGSQDTVSTARVKYVTTISLTSGHSMNADKSAVVLAGARFEVLGTGSMATGSAISTVVKQGIDYR